jgi:hypothetical protein
MNVRETKLRLKLNSIKS